MIIWFAAGRCPGSASPDAARLSGIPEAGNTLCGSAGLSMAVPEHSCLTLGNGAGGPDRRRKRTSKVSMKRAMLTAFLLLCAPSQSALAQPSASPLRKEAENWIISETTSPVDYSRQVSATMLSVTSSENQPMSFSMHCRQGKTEVMLGITDFARYPAGAAIALEFLVLSEEAIGNHAIERRWVQYRGEERRWNEISRTTDIALRSDAVSFLKLLPDGGRLFVRVKNRQGVSHDAEFHLAGLGPVRAKFSVACKWPSP